LKSAGLESVGNSLIRLVSRKLSQTASEVENQEEHRALDDNGANAVHPTLPSDPLDDRPIKKSRHSDDRHSDDPFDLPSRQKLGKIKKTIEKLHVLREIQSQCRASGKSVNQYCSHLKKLTYGTINPVMTCLVEHCNNDESEFVRKWGEKFNHTNWGKTRCPGPNPVDGQCGWRCD